MTMMARRRLAGLAVVGALTVGAPWTAFADTVAVDGDSLDTSNSKNSKFALCAGVGSSVDVLATINYSGSKHFRNGGTVTIATSVPAAASEFLTAAGASVVTANWDDSSDSVTTLAMPVTVDADWVAGTYEVTYTISGTDTKNNAYVLTDKNNVEISEKTTGCTTGGGDGGFPPPPANTAPTVDVAGFEEGASYEIGTSITPTCDVSDAEDTNESATPVVGAITGSLSAYGLGTVSVTCSYTDGGGLSGSDTETYTIVDTGVPTITDEGATSVANGSNGWYITAVTNTFRATDTGAGFATLTPKLLTYAFTQTSTSEGPAVTIGSGSVSDVAGNAATAINSAAFKIDLSDPLVTVTGAANNTTFDLCTAGTPTRPTFTASDAISGLDGTEADSWTTPTTASGVGTYTYSATAKDVAGRTTTETRTYKSFYGSAFAGVQQPINGGTTADLGDDNSRFKLGSTVPVKFKLMCGTTPITNAVAKLNVKVADNNPDPGTEEAVSTSAATTGNLFRYDATAGQYIFNLSTKAGYTNPNGTTVTFTSSGTYTLSILLDDGSYRSVNIQLVK